MRVRPGEAMRVGRYLLFDVLASGGMARVHLARMVSDAGFSRVVAVKRLHSHLIEDRQFVAMFRDEARLLARIRHPNVVAILDVVSMPDELFLVMEYVAGESLAHLVRRSVERGGPPPPEIVSAIVAGMLSGLHAAHEAESEDGTPLSIVHRDVSPQNVIVGEDGFARVLDFGIAYASERLQSTGPGQWKGKLEYMAPEQLDGSRVGRRTDVYAAAVVLWEALTGRRLFRGTNDGHTLCLIRAGATKPPSELVPSLPPALDEVVMRALSLDPEARQKSARQLGSELTRMIEPAAPEQVAEWVRETADATLVRRRARVRQIESQPSKDADADVVITRPKNTDPFALTQPAAPNPTPNQAALALSLPVLPPPAPTRRRSALPWLAALAALAIAGSVAYAVLAIRKDLDRDLEPAPVEPAEALLSASPKASSADSELLGADPMPSAWPRTKSRTTSSRTRSQTKKNRPAHCNPPYVVLGDGTRATKLGCD